MLHRTHTAQQLRLVDAGCCMRGARQYKSRGKGGDLSRLADQYSCVDSLGSCVCVCVCVRSCSLQVVILRLLLAHCAFLFFPSFFFIYIYIYWFLLDRIRERSGSAHLVNHCCASLAAQSTAICSPFRQATATFCGAVYGIYKDSTAPFSFFL